MARLPTPGADNDNWGTLLNEFLEVEHNADGTHPDGSTTSKGFVELATQAEVNTGTDAARAVVPATLQEKLSTDLQARTESFAVFNVRDYGATGDSTTDDTAAIQAAADAAYAAQGILYFPAAIYKLTASIDIKLRGSIIRGANPWHTVIRQTTAAAHAFNVIDDPAEHAVMGSGRNQHVRFENLRIQGVGMATATGYGIQADSLGDWLQLDNVTIYGFGRGLSYNGWSQVVVGAGTLLHYNTYNIYADDTGANVNTLSMLGASSARAGTAGIRLGQGFGGVILGGDYGNQPVSVLVQSGGQVTIIGGNYEGCTGTGAFVDVETNGFVSALGCRFLKGSGNDEPPFRVAIGATLNLHSITHSGFATAPLVEKLDNTCVVQMFACNAGTINTSVRVADPGSSFPPVIYPTRQDGAIPAAAANYRGLILGEMGRDASNTMDKLRYYLRDRTAGSDRYLAGYMVPCLENNGTPESAVASGPGMFCRDTATGDLYWKKTGTGNTGWVVLT